MLLPDKSPDVNLGDCQEGHGYDGERPAVLANNHSANEQ